MLIGIYEEFSFLNHALGEEIILSIPVVYFELNGVKYTQKLYFWVLFKMEINEKGKKKAHQTNSSFQKFHLRATYHFSLFFALKCSWDQKSKLTPYRPKAYTLFM